MDSIETRLKMPLWKSLFILIGFPVISTLLSLILLNRNLFQRFGFFEIFWLIITVWYITQFLLLKRIINSEGYSFKDIGYSLNLKKTTWLIIGFFVLSFVIVAFVELALGNAKIDAGKLSDFSNLTPKTTLQRIIFVFMAFTAGVTEEFVYRGFSIRVLQGYKLNKWLTIFVAAIPFVFQHGLKSINQFWWFFIMGIILGVIFVIFKKLHFSIIIHWLIILSALLAILQAI